MLTADAGQAIAQLKRTTRELERLTRDARELEGAARPWARALVAVMGADPGGLTLAALELDGATHDLIVAAGEPCPMCDPDSCPGAIGGRLGGPISDTPPL